MSDKAVKEIRSMDMEDFGKLINAVIQGMKMEFTIYGYDISFWQIFIFGIVASILCVLIGGLLK